MAAHSESPSETERQEKRIEMSSTSRNPRSRYHLVRSSWRYSAISRLSSRLPIARWVAVRFVRCFMAVDLESFLMSRYRHASSSRVSFHRRKSRRCYREHTYRRLRRHWQFINELQYEIDHLIGMASTSTGRRAAISSSLWPHRSIIRTLLKDRFDTTDLAMNPASKIPVETGTYGRTGSAFFVSRMQLSKPGIRSWRPTRTPVRQTRMAYTVNKAVGEVLTTLARQPRAGVLGLRSISRVARKNDRRNGYFELRWGDPRRPGTT